MDPKTKPHGVGRGDAPVLAMAAANVSYVGGTIACAINVEGCSKSENAGKAYLVHHHRFAGHEAVPIAISSVHRQVIGPAGIED